MVTRISENGLYDDLESGWKQSLGSDSLSFIRNWNYFPLNVLLSIVIPTTPVDVTLSVSLDGPVCCLALF